MNNKKWMRVILSALVVTTLTACGISGTGGPSRDADDPDSSGKQTPQNGQAVLGPIVGASVTIRDIEDINTIACSTTTTDNTDLTKAGAVAFDGPCIFEDHLYLLTVTGGNDVDFDDNGERDQTPTPNTGEFRALFSGDQLLQNNWKTNVLTESIYQALQYSLNEALESGVKVDPITAFVIVDHMTKQFIKQDLNGDGIISRFDIALWHPLDNAGAAIDSEKTRFATELIHQNRNRTLAEIPDAEALSGHIDTLAPARQVLAHNSNLLVTTDTTLLIYHYEKGEATLLSSLALGWIYDMTIAGDFLYIALGENGIVKLDIADGTAPQESQRWTNPAERITTLQDRIVFSYFSESKQQVLAEITATTIEIIASIDSAYFALMRQHLPDEATRTNLLKVVGDTLYWSPSGSLKRFVLQNNQWHQQTTLLTSADAATIRIIDDIEIFDGMLYIVNRVPNSSFNLLYLIDSPEFYQATPERQFELIFSFLERRVDILNISDAEHPVAISSHAYDDIEALRRWDGDIVALGKKDISIRYPADLRSKLSLRLPETFSGFYPEKGLVRIGDTLVVAAKENGVLLLTPTTIPTKKYYGHALSEGPVVNSRVVVTPRPANTGSCELQSDAEGMIAIPESCIAENTYYDVAVIGGQQIAGGETSPFLGTMRATIHATTIMQSGWMVSPLTELAWRIFAKSAAQDFGGFSAAYELFSAWWLLDFSDHHQYEYDVARWNPQTEQNRLLLTPEQWQLATQALRNATWNDETTARLIAPYAGVYTFDNWISEVAATEHLVFVAHPDSIDVLSHDNRIQWLQNLPGGADHLFAQGDTLVAINRTNNSIKTYRTTADNLVTEVHSVIDPLIDNMPAFCAAGDLLFSISFSDETAVTLTATAWTITSNGLRKIDSLRIPARELNELNCTRDTLVASGFYHFDVLKLVSNDLSLTDSTDAPPNAFVHDVFFDGTQIYLASGDTDTNNRRYVYTIDNNGRSSLTHTVNMQTDSAIRVAGYLDVNGKKYFADGWDKLMLADATTKRTVVEIPVGLLGLMTSKQNVWIWAGNTLKTIDAGKALTE